MDGFTMFFGVVMLGAFVMLIMSAKKKDTNSSAKGLAILMAITVVICGIVIAVHQMYSDKNAKFVQIEDSYSVSIGYAMGKHLAEKKPKSKVLVIVAPNYQEDKTQQALLKGLKEGLGDSMMKIDVRPLKINLPQGYSLVKVMKAKDFNALEKKEKPTLIVTLVGLPRDLSGLKIWDEVTDDPKRAPRLAVINGAISKLYKAIKSGVIVAAVRYNPNVIVDENDVCPSDYDAAFKKRYLLITTENIDKIEKEFKNKIFKK
jgi:hypothetical protein